MKTSKKKLLFIPFVVLVCLSVVGFVVMELWNYLLPALFHVPAITFWQAVGLFILCKLLFGFGGSKPNRRFGRSWMSRDACRSISPDQRERFRAEMEQRWCGFRKHPEQTGGEETRNG
jgi:hypothetical protein